MMNLFKQKFNYNSIKTLFCFDFLCEKLNVK